MKELELARAAKRLRDDETFKNVITGIQEDLKRVFLNAASSEEDVAEARVIVRGLATIERKINAQIEPLIRAEHKQKGQHRAND